MRRRKRWEMVFMMSEWSGMVIGNEEDAMQTLNERYETEDIE